jgi:hypothetical protein
MVLAITGVGGLLLLIAAQRLGRPALIGPGLLLFAVGVFAAGADAILRRHSIDRSRSTTARQTFTGPAAMLDGLALVVFAFGLAVVGLSFSLAAQARLSALVLERPGLVLVPLGAMISALSTARVIGAREWGGSPWRVLAALPERFAAVILLLLGLVLIGTGVFELTSPAAFDDLLR